MKSLSFLTRISSSKNFWPLLVVVFLTWVAVKPLFGSGYFNMHDDLQMMRQLEMEKCFLDGQIPCRWVPDMGYGFGYPLFNFYPPLPYLFGEVFRLVGYSYVDTAKALFILAFFASGVTMYFFGKKFFGRLGGVVSAVFYVWAPYHAVDSYVRGAMNETWALIWFPLILLFSYNIIAAKFKTWREYAPQVLALALAWFALFTSHNLMVIVFSPFFAVWCLVWLLYHKNWKSVVPLAFSGAFSFGLAAFFTLPVLFEKDVVQTDSLVKGYYEYTAHFPSASQLFLSRFWGYGPSVWMTQDDKMSFQIGWLHWGVAALVGVLVVFHIARNRKKISKATISILLMLFVAAATAFMAHPRSTPIWQMFKALQFIQFPWRYLTMVILGTSFVLGGIVTLLGGMKRYLVSAVLVLGVLIYSWNFFMPEHGKLGPLTDTQKFTGAAWELQQTAGIYDYLPNTAYTAPKEPRSRQADIISGKGEVIPGKSGTNWEEFSVKVTDPISMRINVLDFPTWKVYIDGVEVQKYIPKSEEWGRVYIDVPAGEHKIYAKLFDTPVRSVGNIVSLISWGLLIGVLVIFYKKREPTSASM